MAYPVELLTDRAMCDAATAELQSEKEDLLYRQTTTDYREGKTTTRADEMNQEIATLDSDIAKYNTDIPTMTAGSKNRLKREAELRAAIKRRGDLGAALLTRGPVLAFRIAVDAVQVERSITVLDEAMAEIATHRPTLSA